tara:strand:- start:7246 stop:8091 length:846 start_codon:yes stop_codon:yes gene_type:complete
MGIKKILGLVLLLFNIGLLSNTTEINEYNIEIIIFKYANNQSAELFESELQIPDEKVIEFYKPNLYINKSALNNFSKNNTFFTNLFKNITPKYLNSDEDNSIKTITNLNPKNWFRENNNLDILNKIKGQIIKDKNLEFIDSKSWIQGIDDYKSSKFLYENNKLKNYGFYIKLYKKRFIHVQIKAFIGSNNEDTEIIPVKTHIKELEKKIYLNAKNINNYDLNINYPKDIDNIIINNDSEIDEFILDSDLNIYIDEERRIFNEEIYLFDHPNFGIILSLNQV